MRAFSLAEMMVAIGILGIGLVMVACFFPVSLSQHADTMTQRAAMELARSVKLEVVNGAVPFLFPPPEPYFGYCYTKRQSDRVSWDLYARKVGPTWQYRLVVCGRLPSDVWEYGPDPNVPTACRTDFVTIVPEGEDPSLPHKTIRLAPGAELPPGYALGAAMPKAAILQAYWSGCLYTVLQVDGNGNIRLLERLDWNNDDTLRPDRPGDPAPEVVPMTWYPPSSTGSRSPHVLSLFF